MWPFSRRRADRPRLTGVSEQLWSYDARHAASWRLETDARSGLRPSAARRARAPRAVGARAKLTHYIRAGGMRHETRDRLARLRPVEGQVVVWRLFILFVLLWLIGRWLPV
jgi:hypothetical protein